MNFIGAILQVLAASQENKQAFPLLPEDATAQYLEEKEPFIRDRLRDIWSEFLFA